MRILGIQDFAHDLSATLVEDGKIIAAVEEERFTRVKHQSWGPKVGGPKNAIAWCLKNNNLNINDIDAIAFSWDFNAPMFYQKRRQFYDIENKAGHIEKDSLLKNPLIRNVGNIIDSFQLERSKRLYPKNVKKLFLNHHLSHAASTFRCSGFNKANIIIIDLAGELEATSTYIGENNEIKKVDSYPIKKSIGYLYSMITSLLNLGQHGEGKTMALASYGNYNHKFSVVKVTKDNYFIDWIKIGKLQIFRRTSGELTQIHKDIATTLQVDLEKVGMMLSEKLYKQTGYKNLCLAGGVALNCVMNSKLLNNNFVNDIYIQPAANDSGTSLGAALEGYKELSGNDVKLKMNHPYFGPNYNNEEIEKILRLLKVKYEYHKDIESVTAELISKNNVIGWFQGKMELGPRALGNRSIICDPCDKKLKDILNIDIKHREPWRPLAPSILIEDMNKWFYPGRESPFMILNFDVKEEKRKEIPGVVHVDNSARVQTVHKETNPKYYKMLKSLKKIKNIPLVLNTSFNDTEPIVMSPQNALKTFFATGIDYLSIGNYIVKKK